MTSGRLFLCGAGSSPLRGRSLLPAAWSEAPSIIEVAEVFLERRFGTVSRGPPHLGRPDAPQHVDRGERPACGVRAYQLPSRAELRLHVPVHLRFPLHFFVETDIPEELLDIAVVCRDVACHRRTVAVLLQDMVGGVPVDGHAFYVHTCVCARLLLEDREHVPVEAGAVDAHHVAETLAEVAGKDEHVTHTLHVADVLAPARYYPDGVMEDVRHVVGSERDLLMAVGRYLHHVIGGRHAGAVPGRPFHSCAELRAYGLYA